MKKLEKIRSWPGDDQVENKEARSLFNLAATRSTGQVEQGATDQKKGGNNQKKPKSLTHPTGKNKTWGSKTENRLFIF